MSSIDPKLKELMQSLHFSITKAMETGCILSCYGKEIYTNNKPTITEIAFQIDKELFEKINQEDYKRV